MAKYHVNPATGQPGACNAANSCPFGGESDHYSSAQEAQAAYETSMAGSFEPRFNADEYREALSRFPTYLVTKTEAKMLADVGEGKRPSDEKLDTFLDANRHMVVETVYNGAEDARAAREVFEQLTRLREESPRPSTLVTGANFDPATQSVYSKARKDLTPAAMGVALRKEAAHGDWMRELAEEESRASASFREEGDEKTALLYELSATTRRQDALRSDARLNAMVRELEYRYSNDETFAAQTPREVQAVLKDGKVSSSTGGLVRLPIGTVRKV